MHEGTATGWNTSFIPIFIKINDRIANELHSQSVRSKAFFRRQEKQVKHERTKEGIRCVCRVVKHNKAARKNKAENLSTKPSADTVSVVIPSRHPKSLLLNRSTAGR